MNGKSRTFLTEKADEQASKQVSKQGTILKTGGKIDEQKSVIRETIKFGGYRQQQGLETNERERGIG